MSKTLAEHSAKVLEELTGEGLWEALLRALHDAQKNPTVSHPFVGFTSALQAFAVTGNVAEAVQLQKALQDLIADDFRRQQL